MKKYLIFMLLCGFCMADETEKFFYDRGYENGWNKGYESGVNKGLEIAKKVIEKYKNRIHAYELGKYLLQDKKITYPQVYQVLNPQGGVSFEVMPSKIEKELNIDDIFAIFAEMPTKDYIESQDLSELNNSVLLHNRDSNTNNIADSASRDSNIVYLSVKKTYKNESILRKANVVYEEGEESYRVMFFSDREKKDFCVNFNEVCESK